MGRGGPGARRWAQHQPQPAGVPPARAGTFSLDNTGLKFTVTSLPGGDGDSDNDGQSNAFEYAVGTDADASTSRFTFGLSSLTVTGTILYFAPALSNRIYALEAGEHLVPASWQTMSNALFTLTNGGQSVLDPSIIRSRPRR